MGAFDDLVYANQQTTPHATPKHQIDKSVITKEAKRKEKKLSHKQFREAVWARDQHCSRASGKRLARQQTDPHKVGEVHHVIPRSLAPERVYDVANGLLLSRFEHALAETACPNDPAHHYLDIDGPDDRGQLQTFIWRDRTAPKQNGGLADALCVDALPLSPRCDGPPEA